jgi:type I restriction enzyme, S subunit
MSEASPEGWEETRFGDYCECIRGVSYKPADLSTSLSSQTITLLRSNNIQEYGLNFDDVQYVSSKTVKYDQIARSGDVAICMSNGSRKLLGKTSAFKNIPTNGALTVGAFCSILRTKDTNLSDFIGQLLKSNQFMKQVEISLAGSAINNLKNSDIREFRFKFPPLPEQKKIASILTSVDEVIEKTQSQIDKLQDLKKGTMNELLTKGIGHTEFKDSDLGRIPKGWEVKSLSELKLDISDGNYSTKYPTSNEFIENGIPFLRANNIGALEINAKDLRYISPEKHAELKKGHLKRNDILISTRGEIGKVCLVQDSFIDVNINAQMVRVNGGKILNHHFLLYIMSSNFCKKQFRNLQTGTALKQLPVGNLLTLQIPLAPLEEQTKIGESLWGLDTNILNLEIKKKKTQSLKTSLMQDLLTGKVRVSVN